MNRSYYSLPLRLDELIRKRPLPVCGLEHSIAQHLNLIISCYQGELGYSDEFGCSLWDEEFNIQLNNRWKEHVCESIRQAVLRFEPRLRTDDVRAVIREQNEVTKDNSLRIRRCLEIDIRGAIKKTNEPFHFRDRIFISPLAQG